MRHTGRTCARLIPAAPQVRPLPLRRGLTGQAPRDMLTHMKTTIDIADDLFLRSKQVSKEQGITLRELMSEGLVYVLEKRAAKPVARVKAVTFKGKGLAPEFRKASWGAIRDAAYEGHGS